MSSLSSLSGCNVLSLVEHWFFCVWSRCPLAVATDLGRYLHTFSAMSSGHMVKCPLLMALIQVEGTGLKHAEWRNCMSSDVVDKALALRCGIGEATAVMLPGL